MGKSPWDRVKGLLKSMSKFGLTSVLATLIDFCLFTFVFLHLFDIFYAELFAAFVGMVVNFFMQKRFVFMLNRKVHWAFILSVLFSVILMFGGAAVIGELVKIQPFESQPVLAKVIIMGSKFVLNYFSKKWVFEKKL